MEKQISNHTINFSNGSTGFTGSAGSTGSDGALNYSSFSHIFVIIIIIIIFSALALLVLMSIGKKYIVRNWVKYRCNPIIIPFAGVFGKDSEQVMQICSGMIADSQAKSQLLPVKSQLSGTLGILGNFGNMFQTLRKRSGTFQALLMGTFGMLYSKIQSVGEIIHLIFIRLSEVLKKHFGIFLVIYKVLLTTYHTFNSVLRGPIGQLGEFLLCFDENTEIDIPNGLTKKIKYIQLGDRLLNNSKVIGTLEFSAENVDMYSYNNIIVSGTHLVNENNSWIRVNQSKSSQKLRNYTNKTIHCLITSNNLITINNIIFRDYIELNNNYTNNKMKQYILEHLNDEIYDKPINIGENYVSGFHKHTKIEMDNGSYKTMDTIKIGDNTINGKILGIILLKNTSEIYTDGTNYFSENNIYKINNSSKWELVSNSSLFRHYGNYCNTLYHLKTETGIITLENGLEFTDFIETTDKNTHNTIDTMIERIIFNS